MTARGCLAAVWLIAPLVACGIPLTLFGRGTLGPDTVVGAVRDLGQLFVPFVGVVLAFVYQAHRAAASGRRQFAAGAVIVALTTSVIWNLVVLVPLIQAAAGVLSFEAALRTASDLAGALSWIVAPALGYFFGGTQSRERHTQQPA